MLTTDPNARDPNARDPNAGDRNARDPNARDRNAGDRNARDPNARDRNAGDRNARDRNARDRNAGGRNASAPNLLPRSRISYTAFGEPIVCGTGGGGGGGGDPCGTGTLAGGCQDWTIGGDLPGAPEDPNCATFALPPLPRYGYAGGFGYQSGRAKTRYAARYGAVAGSDPNLPGADAPYGDLLTLKGANPALPVISLQHLGHRWYDPGTGRFLQRDPIGLAGGMNLYAYARGNPAAGVDPRGTDVWVDWNGTLHPVDIIGPIGGEYYEINFYPNLTGAWWEHIVNVGASIMLGSAGHVDIHTTQRPSWPPVRRSSLQDDVARLHWAADQWYYQVLWRNCITFHNQIVDMPPPDEIKWEYFKADPGWM